MADPFASKRAGKTLPKRTMQDIVSMGETSQAYLSAIRDELMSPYPRKKAPVYRSSQIAEFCGMSRKALDYHLANNEELKKIDPQVQEGGRLRMFSLEDAIKIITEVGKFKRRGKGKKGKVIALAVFKGGTGKTSTAVHLSQALTLKGYKVLVIDMDAQGSTTQLLGYAPDSEIGPESTILPVFYHRTDPLFRETLEESIQTTYWANLDLIAASSQLFESEMCLTGKMKGDPKFEFWRVLETPLDKLRDVYDVIIIDTPPALSYTNLNALYACDGMIVPVPPASLDFASSTEFWWLLGELLSELEKADKQSLVKKEFDFINVLITKVTTHEMTDQIIEWIRDAYEGYVLPMTIPESQAIKNAASEFSTLYDKIKPDGSMESYKKAKKAYDELADYVADAISREW